ncbi:hypothetical protein WA1_29790 [Scytonema hofmannii PCC 7110]|uniref:Lipopolysaccharide assembly protein A domain-containing protein n=1 Tax=Scytonema hofmannii PCC 7110 TaxID=128403 RepID=A0A139X5Z9_9CYAN|nr:hypothetical protein [Scytonema hofmannii]KYC40137.1 hypothetical protein WA1_29790 [Scytonema hofmannii PCC 7110]
MALIRLILLVAVLGGITLLLLQNWSPVLPLVFLGMRSQPLPLAIWILFSTVAGGLTTILLTILFNLSGSLRRQRQTPLRSAPESSRQNKTRVEEPTSSPPNPPSSGDRESRTTDTVDDWETGSGLYEDWEFNKSDSQKTQVKDPNTYDRSSEPQDRPKTDSSYSYSYREPKNSGVGKTESVYDADYRVIIPPYQPPKPEPVEEDDWGFLDDDAEDEDKPPRR